MRELLAETGADYLVLPAQDVRECGPPLSQVFLNEGFAVHHLAETLAAGAASLSQR